MATTEIDSFYVKFKALFVAGFKATLTIEAEEGEAFITLKAGVGKITNKFNATRNQSRPCSRRSPSYFRRQIKRREHFSQSSNDKSAETAVDEDSKNLCIHDENIAEKVIVVVKDDNGAEATSCDKNTESFSDFPPLHNKKEISCLNSTSSTSTSTTPCVTTVNSAPPRILKKPLTLDGKCCEHV